MSSLYFLVVVLLRGSSGSSDLLGRLGVYRPVICLTRPRISNTAVRHCCDLSGCRTLIYKSSLLSIVCTSLFLYRGDSSLVGSTRLTGRSKSTSHLLCTSLQLQRSPGVGNTVDWALRICCWYLTSDRSQMPHKSETSFYLITCECINRSSWNT